MGVYEINNKKLHVPSFFQVYNFGGGCGDKVREIVYSDLTNDTPGLLNYSYLAYNKKNEAGSWGSKWTSHLDEYLTIGDFLDYVRKDLIVDKKNVYNNYEVDSNFSFNNKLLLLDSGASIIVKMIASKEINYNSDLFIPALLKHMKQYYDFANRYKFDLVVGFDLGGKYTFKDNETKDKKLIQFYNELDKDNINKILLEESIKYLKDNIDFYPKVLATVHGRTPLAYKNYVDYILEMEKKYKYNFWGFALGGVASPKGMDDSWFEDIKVENKIQKNALIPAIASKIVHDSVGNRPIHALGCGGYTNIPLNYYCGATSFDAATPARRVGDGNALSSEYVFAKSNIDKGAKFSKMLVGGFNANLEKVNSNEKIEYIKINEIPDDVEKCGCMACAQFNSFLDVKKLYAKKAEEGDSGNECFYYSRQLMNIHSVWQHQYLCKLAKKYNNIDQLVLNHADIELFSSLSKVYKQIRNKY